MTPRAGKRDHELWGEFSVRIRASERVVSRSPLQLRTGIVPGAETVNVLMLYVSLALAIPFKAL
jgi:hypothetical protein